MRIHTVGASGSGTTTLAIALSQELKIPHFDTDDFFWMPTNPPYTTKRSVPERVAALADSLSKHESWVLSGSLVGWGEPIADQFSLVIFLTLPPEIRLARIKAREVSRYGSRIEPGGDMHAAHLAFIEWAKGYDEDGFTGRSKRMHEEWLKRFACPVIRLEGAMATSEQVRAVVSYTKAF